MFSFTCIQWKCPWRPGCNVRVTRSLTHLTRVGGSLTHVSHVSGGLAWELYMHEKTILHGYTQRKVVAVPTALKRQRLL